MLRYTPRLIAAGSAPAGSLIEPLIVDPPTSPLGEHELIPQVAWMVERDDAYVHVPDADRDLLEVMRGSAELTKLDGTLTNESIDALPGVNIATIGEYAAELFLDGDHLAAVHQILGHKVYLAAAPRRGRFLIGGVGAGIEGMRAFVEHARREHEAAPAADRISPVALLVRDATPIGRGRRAPAGRARPRGTLTGRFSLGRSRRLARETRPRMLAMVAS